MTSKGPKPAIVRTSPPREGPASSHPRRAPAHQVVSLLHSPSRRRNVSSTEPGTRKQSIPSQPSSLVPLGGRGSSGESSNAENWFDQSNNEVLDKRTSFADNEPPFFMRTSSSESPPDYNPRMKHHAGDDNADSLPLRTGLLQLGTEGSSTDDFRGVIDDLTIENKKLKRRLKKYEKYHDSHLKKDRLFEVRIHGLPPEKKGELEETLRKFAANMDTTGANAFPSDGYASLMPILKTHKPSSQVSLQQTDSAYASMSTSGQPSSARSGNDSKDMMTPISHLASQQQNVRDYPHHIPEGLLPQENPATLSDRAKKRLVVRRMEQLFAGKGAATADHQQTIQQEEVSQSAATADRTAIEASGQRTRQEGTREACIMLQETEDPQDLVQGEDKPAMEEGSSEESQASVPPSNHTSRIFPGGSLDQRPTRPLDLDPHRAQVPAENIDYMRHLGFSPKDPDSASSPEEGHGWIYLNFLVNMAQLHTVNVTLDFVRKALAESSTKLEVSSDGRRVRWRGGRSITRTSSSGDGSERAGDDVPEGQASRKRVKLSHPDGARSNRTSGLQSGGASRSHRQELSKHSYTPLFFHRDSTDGTDDSSSADEAESESFPFPYQAAGASTGMTSSGIHTSSVFPRAAAKRKEKHDDGPIIFYNNARFCTDLSGDRGNTDGSSNNIPIYTPASAIPIGKRRPPVDDLSETRGPLAIATELPEPMDLQDNPIPNSMELSFPQQSPLGSDVSEDHKPLKLEVTGIGGVWPADNFAISVNSLHARIDQEKAPSVSNSRAAKTIPSRLSDILHGPDAKARTRAAVHKQVIASDVHHLPPSALPPAISFMPSGIDFAGDDDDDEEFDSDDAMSDVSLSDNGSIPAAAPQPLDLPYAYDSDSDDGEDDADDDDDDDDEVDFLATARRLDPEAVRQQEREYDSIMAERLADEIPPGSSAATAGGGSGFDSPASGVDLEQHRRAAREARLKAARLGRTEAHTFQEQRDGSDSPSDDDDDDDDDDEEMSDVSS